MSTSAQQTIPSYSKRPYQGPNIACFRHTISLNRKRAEYCFESTVSEKRTHWASLSFGANSVSSAKNSVSSRLHTNNRLKGTHWVRSPELNEPRITHWVRCLKPYSLKPYSACFRLKSPCAQDHAFTFLFWPVRWRAGPRWCRVLVAPCLLWHQIRKHVKASNRQTVREGKKAPTVFSQPWILPWKPECISQVITNLHWNRERKLTTNFFFSNFSGTPGISQQNPGISRPKSLISLVSRDVSNFLARTHSRGRPPPHWKISGPKVWVWVLFPP